MSKNLKLCFILHMTILAIAIAWNSLFRFFGGVGVPFVAILVLLAILVVKFCLNSDLRHKTTDLLIISCVMAVLEFIVFFLVDFRIGSYKVVEAMMGLQNVYVLIALLLLAYEVLRLIFEVKGKQIGFVEIINGNKTRERKPKKARELYNGSLLDKPNNSSLDSTNGTTETSTDETENVEIEDESSEE